MTDIATTPEQDTSEPTAGEPDKSGAPRSTTRQRDTPREPGSELITDQGRTSIADAVVSKIAGVAAREIDGVHSMGSTTSRVVGAVRDSLGQPSATQGVHVEVGERQAAIDITLVVDYGVSIIDVTQAVRENTIDRIERMTGLEITEVNIDVTDVALGDELKDDSSDDRPAPPPPPRVR